MACAAVACLLAPAASPSGALAPAAGAVTHVDGISDQSLPAWGGGFPASRLALRLRSSLSVGPGSPITLARYVVQWDVMREPSGGANPHGNYRERVEAWLADVHSLGLAPVVALTSYDGVHPSSAGEYSAALAAILLAARELGGPIGYIEPWNEPNNQGRESAAKAAEFANAANALCLARACRVIAGGFEDSPGSVAYAQSYERGLRFVASAWGVHPYYAVKTRADASLLRLKAALPAGGLGAELWLTEIGTFYCRHGRVLGQAAQAAEASYLINRLIADPAVAPAHVLYFGLLYADGRLAPCGPSGGDDPELYGPSGEARAAAAVVLPEVGAAPVIPAPGAPSHASPPPSNELSLLFGPGPGAEAL